MSGLDTPTTRLERLTALRAAQELALSSEMPTRDFAAISREYRATLAEIAELDPQRLEVDDVDEITQRRNARRAGGAKSPSRSKRSS